MFLALEPQQPVDDLVEEIEALRDQTIALQSQPPIIPETLDLEQLLTLGQETVAEGETIYAQSVAGSSIIGDDAVAISGSAPSVSVWLYQQALEASRLSLPLATDADDSVYASWVTPGPTHTERKPGTITDNP